MVDTIAGYADSKELQQMMLGFRTRVTVYGGEFPGALALHLTDLDASPVVAAPYVETFAHCIDKDGAESLHPANQCGVCQWMNDGAGPDLYVRALAAAPKPSEQADPAPSVAEMLGRLRHCATTMMNDDFSEPMTERRDRLIVRIETVNDAHDAIADHARIVAEKDADTYRARAALETSRQELAHHKDRADALAGVLAKFLLNFLRTETNGQWDCITQAKSLLSEAGK